MLTKVATVIEWMPRWFSVVIAHFLFYSLYFLTNHYQLFEPKTLPLYNFEEMMPFVGWTSLIYLTTFIEIPLAMFLYPKKGYGWIVIAVTGLFMTCIIFFILFPTTFPRPSGNSNITIFDMFRKVEMPTNCFPSLHCATSAFIALTFWWQKQSNWRFVFIPWGMAIALSTLTTKQHYAIDIMGGWILALIFARWAIEKIKGGQTTPRD